jgi:hypothetical protein
MQHMQLLQGSGAVFDGFGLDSISVPLQLDRPAERKNNTYVLKTVGGFPRFLSFPCLPAHEWSSGR